MNVAFPSRIGRSLTTTKFLFRLCLTASFPARRICVASLSSMASSAPAAVVLRKPSLPLQYQPSSSTSDGTSRVSLNLDDLSAKIDLLEAKRQLAYDLSRKFQVALVKLKQNVASVVAVEDNLQHFVEQISMLNPDAAERKPRLANLSFRMEDYARCRAYHHFLETGFLLPPSACPSVSDEEYLAGACMGLAQDLQQYGLGRATARDNESVQMAADLVSDVNEFLLGMDFRNGPLRRKYDGTKYALKGLETILYELAVTTTTKEDDEVLASAPQSKRQRHESSSLIPIQELKELQERMVHRDELRETLIKRCRDAQKDAKQSIFALHRGDWDRARTLLTQCHKSIVEMLLPIAKEEPPLRNGGSLAGVLEEYVEAKMFATWLYGVDLENPSSTQPSGVLLKPDDFDVDLELDEYFGGLCDLTGEVGRYAVQRGTARDEDGVKLCLQTNSNIWYALQTMQRLPGGIGKKMDPLEKSVQKLERMLYEMSLSQAAGGRNVKTEVDLDENELT